MGTEERALCRATVLSPGCPVALVARRAGGQHCYVPGLEIPPRGHILCCADTAPKLCSKRLHGEISLLYFRRRDDVSPGCFPSQDITISCQHLHDRGVRGKEIEREKMSLVNLMSFLHSRSSHPITGRLSKQRVPLHVLDLNIYLKIEELGSSEIYRICPTLI